MNHPSEPGNIESLVGNGEEARLAAVRDKENIDRLNELTGEMELFGEPVSVDPELADLIGAIHLTESEFDAL